MLLARLIYAEARGESFLGQIAVGAVTLNRLASPHFPKTLTKVIFEKTTRSTSFRRLPTFYQHGAGRTGHTAGVRALEGDVHPAGHCFFYNPDIRQGQWIDPAVVKGSATTSSPPTRNK